MSSMDEIGGDDKNIIYCEDLLLRNVNSPVSEDASGVLNTTTSPYFDVCINPILYRYHAFLSIRVRNNPYKVG